MLRADERQEQILRLLRKDAAVRIATLAQSLGVTTETVRRDLARLSDSGQLQRTYGGATLPPDSLEPRVAERAAHRVLERHAIARTAATLVEPGDVLFVDAGSTTSAFARALAGVVGLTVISNGFEVATGIAMAPQARVLMCPGDYSAREGGVTGTETITFLDRFRAGKAFISASGLTAAGVMEADSGAASVKRAMLRGASRRILLADSGKFGCSAFELVCPWPMIDDLVCDEAPTGELLGSLGAVQLHVGLRSVSRAA